MPLELRYFSPSPGKGRVCTLAVFLPNRGEAGEGMMGGSALSSEQWRKASEGTHCSWRSFGHIQGLCSDYLSADRGGWSDG